MNIEIDKETYRRLWEPQYAHLFQRHHTGGSTVYYMIDIPATTRVLGEIAVKRMRYVRQLAKLTGMHRRDQKRLKDPIQYSRAARNTATMAERTKRQSRALEGTENSIRDLEALQAKFAVRTKTNDGPKTAHSAGVLRAKRDAISHMRAARESEFAYHENRRRLKNSATHTRADEKFLKGMARKATAAKRAWRGSEHVLKCMAGAPDMTHGRGTARADDTPGARAFRDGAAVKNPHHGKTGGKYND